MEFTPEQSAEAAKGAGIDLAATRALMYVDIAARHKESFIHVSNIKAF